MRLRDTIGKMLAASLILVMAGAAIAVSTTGPAWLAPSLMLFSQAQNTYTISGYVTNTITANPIQGVTVNLAAEFKQLATTQTNENGFYEFDGLPNNDQKYLIDFNKREYVSDQLRNLDGGQTDANISLEPVGVTKPRNILAYSGPRSIYIEWDANPEYNLKGYYLWRAETNAEGADLNAGVKITGLLPADSHPEFTDTNVNSGIYYKYFVTALNAGDRESLPSDWSGAVKAEFLTVFFPEISVQSNLSGLYLWDLTPENLGDRSWVRFPISTECAYQVDAAGIDIVADLPNNLVKADARADIQVLPTGITEGMTFSYNIVNPTSTTSELRISSADVVSRSLFGTGVLFDVYAQVRETTGCADLLLVEDQFDTGGRQGVRMYDITPAPIDLELLNGSLCVDFSPCVHGDVSENRQVTNDDAQLVTELKVGITAPEALGLECYPWSADINQDKRVDSADASMILQWVANGTLNPPPAQGKSLDERKSYCYSAWSQEDDVPAVSIGQVSGAPGQLVQTALAINSADELPLAGFSALVAYPAGADGLIYQTCQLGSELEGSFELSAKNNVDNLWYGSVQLSASNAEQLDSKGAITLVLLSFTVGPDAVPGTFDVALKSFESNDPYGYTPRHGAPGQADIVQQLPPQEYTLTMNVQGQGSTTPAAGTHTRVAGTIETLTAFPVEGWGFDHWEGPVADPTLATTTITLNSDATITAVFLQALPFYTLSIASQGQGSTTPSTGNHTYEQGSVVSLTATPADGWEFVRWDGTVADPNSATTTITVNAASSVMAVFEEKEQEKENQFLWCAPGSHNGKGSPLADAVILLALGVVLSVSAKHRAHGKQS